MILLRKEIQTVLFDAGLGDLYLAKNGHNQIYIAGPCGRIILAVPDIVVPSSINSKEREYLVELVTKFVEDKADDIDAIWTAFKKEVDLPNYTMKKNGFTLGYNNFSKKESFHLGTGEYTLVLPYNEEDDTVWIFSNMKEEEIVKVLSNKDEAVSVAEAYRDMWKKKKDVDKMISQLQNQSCRF